MPFSKETLDFLLENRARDSKAWFREHEAEFRALVLDPLRELCCRLAPAVQRIDPACMTEPKVGRCLSRIYRDTRFTRDKSVFRDVMWLQFSRDRRLYYGPPCCFFELSPTGFRYGCGYYQADRDAIERMRRMILTDDPAYLAAARAYRAQTVFALEGDRYKRAKYPDQPEEKRDWLERKNLCFTHNSRDFGLLFSEELADVVGANLLLTKPMYEFFQRAESSK